MCVFGSPNDWLSPQHSTHVAPPTLCRTIGVAHPTPEKGPGKLVESSPTQMRVVRLRCVEIWCVDARVRRGCEIVEFLG